MSSAFIGNSFRHCPVARRRIPGIKPQKCCVTVKVPPTAVPAGREHRAAERRCKPGRYNTRRGRGGGRYTGKNTRRRTTDRPNPASSRSPAPPSFISIRDRGLSVSRFVETPINNVNTAPRFCSLSPTNIIISEPSPAKTRPASCDLYPYHTVNALHAVTCVLAPSLLANHALFTLTIIITKNSH